MSILLIPKIWLSFCFNQGTNSLANLKVWDYSKSSSPFVPETFEILARSPLRYTVSWRCWAKCPWSKDFENAVVFERHHSSIYLSKEDKHRMCCCQMARSQATINFLGHQKGRQWCWSPTNLTEIYSNQSLTSHLKKNSYKKLHLLDRIFPFLSHFSASIPRRWPLLSSDASPLRLWAWTIRIHGICIFDVFDVWLHWTPITFSLVHAPWN